MKNIVLKVKTKAEVASKCTTKFKLQTSRIAIMLSSSLLFLNNCAAMPPSETAAGSTSNVDMNIQANVRPASWKFQNEQEWMVDGIGRDIAEILGYAKFGKDSKEKFISSTVDFKTKIDNQSTNSYSYSLSYPGASAISYKFSLQDYAWSPKNYEPFAQEILSSLKLTPSTPSTIPDDYLKNISKADFASLFLENKRISKALTENPLDASLHEQAAMLQGVFNMLEMCGLFSDTRAPLNRMAAHLSIAKALNKDKLSNVGQIANIALESMSCRDGVAVSVVDEMSKQNLNPTEKSFLRALKIRGTANYRLFNEAEATPIEEFQYGLRLAQTRGIEEAMEVISKKHTPLSIQWKRILGSGPMSVQTGHVLQANQVSAEIADLMKSRNAFKGENNENVASYVDELNLPSSRCLSSTEANALTVLSWDDIAAFYSRHIAFAITQEYLFNQRMYGVEELAAKTRTNAQKLFSKLTIFPLVRSRFNMEGQEKDQFLTDYKKLLVYHPELMTAHNWKQISTVVEYVAPQFVLPQAELWFDPPMPMGTVFYFRDNLKNCKKNLAELTEWKNLNPYMPTIAMAWVKKKYGPNPTGEQYREAFGPMADFDVTAMRFVTFAEIDNPEKFLAAGEKLAKEDPEMYFDMGNYCVINNRPEDAAKYFQMGIEKHQDAISISNSSDWLVMYLLGKKENQKAEELAKSAAEVYSARGLLTLSRFYERTGKMVEAEAELKKLSARYRSNSELLSFYLRNSDKDKRYQQMAEELKKQVFPEGMKKVTLANFSGPPKSGLEITYENAVANKSPLKAKTVVVAVNGYAVNDKDQWDTVRGLGGKPTVWVIYWDGKEYKETTQPTIHHNALNIQFKKLGSPG